MGEHEKPFAALSHIFEDRQRHLRRRARHDPILSYEFIEKRGWITEAELTDYYAVGQCTPGIIAVNVSTFVGNKRGGLPGGIVATLGFVTAPLLLLIAIAASLRSFAQVPAVRSAFAGIRVCVCVLIVNAVLRLWKNSVVDRTTLLLFAAAFAVSAGSPYMPFRARRSSSSPLLLFGIAWRRDGRARDDLLLRLFYEFFKVGLFASAAAGDAAIPLFSPAGAAGSRRPTSRDMIAVAESTRAIGVNMATFAGYERGDLRSGRRDGGARAAVDNRDTADREPAGHFQERPVVKDAFYGLRPASIALIAASGMNVVAVTLLDLEKFKATGGPADLFAWKAILFGLILFAAQKRLKWSPVVFIAISAAVGVIFNFSA
ncbi:MAG: chromate transporter [Cloacibacillus evryensis]